MGLIHKYRTADYTLGIEKTVLIKETAKKYRVERVTDAVGYGSSKYESLEFKECGYYRYHDTWLEAKNFLLEQYADQIESLESGLKLKREDFRTIYLLEEI